MKRFWNEVVHDLKRMIDYQVLQITLVLSLVFAAMMALMPSIDAIHFFSLSLFIVPIIMFSIATFLRKEELTEEGVPCSVKLAAFHLGSHAVSALIVETIPFVLYGLVMVLFRSSAFSFPLYVLAYFSGAFLHVLIAMYLALTSQTLRQLALGYIVYVLVFSMTPILYANGIIPYLFQYWMLISPAYVSGLLLDNVLTGIQFSSDWLIALSAVIQVSGILLLFRFALIPLLCKSLSKSNPTDTPR